jgi:hypothetical protein
MQADSLFIELNYFAIYQQQKQVSDDEDEACQYDQQTAVPNFVHCYPDEWSQACTQDVRNR